MTSKPSPPASDVRAVLDSLRQIVRALRLVAKAAETELGISTAQLFVLQVLAETEGATINEIAERTCTDQSSVSVIVSRLVQGGLVNRRRDPADARRVIVTLTDEGIGLLDRSPPTIQVRLIDALGRMPATRRRVLARELSLLAGSVEANDRAPPMFFEERPDRPKTRQRRQ